MVVYFVYDAKLCISFMYLFMKEQPSLPCSLTLRCESWRWQRKVFKNVYIFYMYININGVFLAPFFLGAHLQLCMYMDDSIYNQNVLLLVYLFVVAKSEYESARAI